MLISGSRVCRVLGAGLWLLAFRPFVACGCIILGFSLAV